MAKKQSKSPQKMRRKTVGEVAVELQQKTHEAVSPIEIQRETEKKYIDDLLECARNDFNKYDKDFYIVVISKNEKLLYNVIRLYFFSRASCPTPDYDQTVFLVKKKEEDIVHLWTVPNKESCILYSENTNKVDPSEYPLLENILRFLNGDLFKLCKELNREEALSIDIKS